MAVSGEVKRVGEDLAGFLEVGVRGAQLRVDVPELAGDAFLLDLEQVEWDRAGVVGVEDLLSLGSQGDALLLQFAPFCVCRRLEGFEVLLGANLATIQATWEALDASLGHAIGERATRG